MTGRGLRVSQKSKGPSLLSFQTSRFGNAPGKQIEGGKKEKKEVNPLKGKDAVSAVAWGGEWARGRGLEQGLEKIN